MKPRPPQTRIKHLILEKYLNAWGSIIINGLKAQPTPLHLIYIDCNASFGRYPGELKDKIAEQAPLPVFGSPIIGIRVLDGLASRAQAQYGKNVRTSAILVEKDPKVFSELKQSLSMAGFAQRTRETTAFSTLKDTEIAILCADSTQMASQLIAYTQSEPKFSFFLLDPYGPTGIPLDFVSEIIRQPKHDVIINMPYQDLHKKSGIAAKLNQLAVEKELVKNYDAMFGHTKWQNIARMLDPSAIWEEEEAEYPSEAAVEKANEARTLEIELMNCYKASLQEADTNLTVKSIPLHFPDRERTMYYLYLTTHDPYGALQMNKVLWDAGQEEHELRWELLQLKKWRYQPTLPFFDLPAPIPQTPQRASTEEIARHILTLLGGKTATTKMIYKALANEPYFPTEVNTALKALRKQGRASFDDPLRSGTRIKLM